RDQLGEVAGRVARDAPAGVFRAELPEDPRHGGEAAQLVRVKLARHDHGVEHQTVHVLRVADRIVEGDLGAVRHAIEVDLVHAYGAAHRLEVGHRLGGREEVPDRAEPSRTAAHAQVGQLV